MARTREGLTEALEAIPKLRRVWASFPGAGYAGQGMRSLNWMTTAYQQAGGYLA